MKCPGQDTRYWKYGDVFESGCPYCGETIEFFKDDPSRLCKACGKRVVNPKMDFGCAAYCKFAEQCLGALPEEFREKRAELLKDRVAKEVKALYGQDFKGIGHVMRTARYAERIAKSLGVPLGVVLSAAYLHELPSQDAKGTPRKEETAHSGVKSADQARVILENMSAGKEFVEEVLGLIEELNNPKEQGTDAFKALSDAHLLAMFEEDVKTKGLDLDRVFRVLLTEEGKKIAQEIVMYQMKEKVK